MKPIIFMLTKIIYVYKWFVPLKVDLYFIYNLTPPELTLS